jgi:hypothetical protein
MEKKFKFILFIKKIAEEKNTILHHPNKIATFALKSEKWRPIYLIESIKTKNHATQTLSLF